MYGSVFRMKPKPGMAKKLQETMIGNARRPNGMVTGYLLQEDASGDVWGIGIFEDEKSYRANANDPAQNEVYQQFRALLESDPEWHDGSIQERSMAG